jgi:hypothetical protein
MKTFLPEKTDRTPEEQLGLAKIQIMFEDSFGMFNATSGHIKDVQIEWEKEKQLIGLGLLIVSFSVT